MDGLNAIIYKKEIGYIPLALRYNSMFKLLTHLLQIDYFPILVVIRNNSPDLEQKLLNLPIHLIKCKKKFVFLIF